MNSPIQNPVRPANWLLAKLRKWHTWTGLAAALFLLVISLTGIVLNYKRPIFQALRLAARPPEPKAKTNEKAGHAAAPALPAAKLGGLPITFDQALALARAEFGEAPVERVELKREPDDWLYKIKRPGGAELWISASSGAHFIKGDYEKVKRVAAGAPVKRSDWGKLMLDLHTGKIGGPVGVAVMTGVAGLLFFLTLSGVYMWLKPWLIRRRTTTGRAAAIPAQSAPIRATAGIVPAVPAAHAERGARRPLVEV